MDHIDATQINASIQKQNEFLNRIVTASERTNELLWALLSPEQRKAVQTAAVQHLAKNSNKSRQP
jgi:hypothetical protein